MFRGNVSIIITHITGWLIFLSLPLLFINGQPHSDANWWELLLSRPYWLFVLVYMLLFYCNTEYLIPQLFFQKKWLAYFGILLAALMLVYYLQPFDRLLGHGAQHGFNRGAIGPLQEGPYGMPPSWGNGFPPPGPPGGGPGGRGPGNNGRHTDMVSIFLFLVVVTLAIAVELTKRWRLTEQRVMRAEADRAHAELSFLKAQINPHFLFNTLNNIYTLALTGNEHTANSIMKLSNIMRYVTDDAAENFVSLESEVDCIRDYIDLQRLRLGKKTRLDFSVSGDLSRKEIAPLILMTFIENVFKYGLSNHAESTLIIRIFAEARTITFFSQNPLFSDRPAQERTGIGILNTRQRLDHLYRNKYLLNITDSDGLYTVELTLQV
jgi:two-component system LytT family sensor kinase